MPRVLDPALRRMLERSNPNVYHAVEVHRPDSTRVLRRSADQFLGAPKVSEVPAASLNADPAGALVLDSGPANLLSFTTQSSIIGLKTSDPSKRLRGLMWRMDTDFTSCILRTFSAIMSRNDARSLQIGLQIYRPSLHRTYVQGTTGVLELPLWSFTPLLAHPVVVRTGDFVWTAGVATVVFDLTDLRVELSRITAGTPGALTTYGGVHHDPEFLFAIDAIDSSKDNQLEWRRDTATSRTVAGVGTFFDQEWTRLDSAFAQLWQFVNHAQAPCATLAVETYDATSQAVYVIDLPSVPVAASAGRVVFERGVPAGTAATLELSTAGSGGPWTAVTDGDAVAIKQAQYHLRVQLDADATQRITPRVLAMGIEFRTPVDVSLEAIAQPITQAISLPFCQAAVGEGSVDVVRTGRRDYRDPGAELATSSPVSRLELDLYLASRHPSAPRGTWFKLDHAFVSNRAPTATAERFSLLSYLKTLKRKIPERAETINSEHTVTAATTGQVTVTPALPGTTGGGNEYDGAGHYMRVRTSSQVGVESGYVQTIDGNTNTDKLTFGLPAGDVLPGTLAINDVIEVHSGHYAQPGLSWVDADPADIWWEILTVHCAVPAERIGRSDLGNGGRSGLPPTVADRAPGDVPTQDSCKVTIALQGAQDADKLIDQLSFVMGGATVEIGGQIVFRQIYPLRGAPAAPNQLGPVTVPAEPPCAVFDARTTVGLDTPVGLEQRITSLACDYGVDLTVESKDAEASDTAVFVDADALAWLSTQDVRDLAHEEIPKDIARWCYNSTDAGFFLAKQMCTQVVLVASTGLRVWSWGSTEQRPEVVVGDRVVVITDQYTDYDPSRRMAIRGLWAFPAVVVQVEEGGGRFRGLIPGLADSVKVQGGLGTIASTSITPGATPPPLLIEIAQNAPSFPTSTFKVTVTVTDPLGGAPDVRVKTLSGTTLYSGTAVGTFAASPQTWEFNLPAALSGSATAVIEAQLGGRTATQTILIPVATTLGSAQGTVSIDVNGSWGFTSDAVGTAQSFKWMASTSGYPSEATVNASGTGVNAPGVFSVSAGGTLAFGETIYITILPYTGASYTGIYGPAIHLRGAYQSYAPTITTAYAPAPFTFVPSMSTVNDYTMGADGEVKCVALAASTNFTGWMMSPVIPQGVTMTTLALDIYDNTGAAVGQLARWYFNRNGPVGGGAGLVLGVDATHGLGWQTLTASSLAEDTTGRTYTQFILLQGPAAAGDLRCGQLFVTTDRPDPAATL